MSNLTWRQRIAAYLIAKGYTRDYTGRQSIHYVRYTKGGEYYFLGKAGAVRYGKSPTLTYNVNVTDRTHRIVIQWEKEQS